MSGSIKGACYLTLQVCPRFWEDASVNGVEDMDGTLIPFRSGDCWCPTIRIEDGSIIDWPPVTARVHYKVCDEGFYWLLASDGSEIATLDGYVPGCLSPLESGYGDYIILDIDEEGKIAGWKVPEFSVGSGWEPAS